MDMKEILNEAKIKVQEVLRDSAQENQKLDPVNDFIQKARISTSNVDVQSNNEPSKCVHSSYADVTRKSRVEQHPKQVLSVTLDDSKQVDSERPHRNVTFFGYNTQQQMGPADEHSAQYQFRGVKRNPRKKQLLMSRIIADASEDDVHVINSIAAMAVLK